jgi:hypothetical protein
MTTDWLARGLGIAGILVGLASPAVTYFIWRRSGSRLKIVIRTVDVTSDRLEDVVRIEVRVQGLQAAMIQRIQLGQRVPTIVVQNQQKYETKWFFDAAPPDGREPLGRLVAPTDRVVADVPITDVAAQAGWNQKNILIQAAATRGDGQTWTSRVVKVATPRQP